MIADNLTRTVWKLSLPIIVVEAMETFDHLIDTLFLALVGVTELGAIAVADSLMLLFLILPLAVVDSLQILTARRVGERQPEGVGVIFNQGLLLVILLGIAATASLKMFSPIVANYGVEVEAVGVAVNSYLQIDAYSIPLVGISFAYSALLTSLGKTRVLIPAAIIFMVTDVLFNYMFIFGNFGCPALGMRGAAVGSIGTELIAVIFLTRYIWRTLASRDYGLFRFTWLERQTVGKLGRLYLPIAGLGVLETVRWFVFFLIIERVGTSALAVANIVFTCYLVFWIPVEGFGEVACSLVSRFVGRNRPQRIYQVLRRTTGGAVLAAMPLIALSLIGPQWVVRAFALEAALAEQASSSLRVVAFALLIAIPGYMWFTAVLSTGDTVVALIIELTLTVLMIGLTYLAAIQLEWSITQIWLVLPLIWLGFLILSYSWMKSGLWKRLEA
jgi:putative MATE family efflux protein